MQLLTRLYVFTVLWIGSLAAPLSHDESTKRNFVESGKHPQLDSVTASAKIGTLDELTQSKTETPFLTVSADALSNPEIISIHITSATLSQKQATDLSFDLPVSVTRTTQDHSQTLVEPLRTSSVSDALPVLALPTALTGTGGRTETTQQVEPFRTSSGSDAFPVLALPTVESLTETAKSTETTQQANPFRTASTSDTDGSTVIALPATEQLTGTTGRTETTQQPELFRTLSSSNAFPVLALPTIEPLTGTGESTETTQEVESSSTSSSSDAFTSLASSTTVQHLMSSGTGESTETTLRANPFRTTSTSDTDAFSVIALPTTEQLSAEPVPTAVPSSGPPEPGIPTPPLPFDRGGWGWPWGGCVVC